MSDNRGKILAETRSDSAPFATLVARVPAVHDTMLYLLLGDWFAWFSIATLVFTGCRLKPAAARCRRRAPRKTVDSQLGGGYV